MNTYTPKTGEVKRDWLLVDAGSAPLGRLATEISKILRGKNKPQFSPHMDNGDFVVVINAKHVVVTGKKNRQKIYKHYSGYPSGLKETPFETMRERHPEKIVESAVKSMLPDNRLSDALIKKLKVYPGAEHPHVAQAPKPVQIA